MPRIAITKEVDASAAAVWTLLADFADVSWIPVAGQVDVVGEGIGMSRSIHGSSGRPVVETLTHLDPERRELGYRIADNPLPVNRFEALVTVQSRPGPGSEVTWNVDYEPSGSTDADAQATRQAIEAVYGMMAGWLADAAAARS